MATERLTLTSPAAREAIRKLEGGPLLPRRTLAEWVDARLVWPSVPPPTPPPGTRRTGRPGRPAFEWSMADLARLRLVVRLRRGGIGLPRVRAIFAYLETDLRDVFNPRSTATLVVDHARAYVVRPNTSDLEVPSGQHRFRFDALFEGMDRAAKRAKAAA